MTKKEYLERFGVSGYNMYCPFVKNVCNRGVQYDSMTKYQCVFWSIEEMKCSISAAITKAMPKVVE